ncbi:MAG: hypothetical protein PHI48_00865 [Bacteroidales bacterium]|nr:hypothetical protein [Bacteroidales bacterium]MDD4821097.1 hypothetical protein [Bacteroidales bacterium]
MEHNDKTKGVMIFNGALWECSIVKGRLNDAGIESFILNTTYTYLLPFENVVDGIGVCKVMISENDQEAASEIMKDIKFGE